MLTLDQANGEAGFTNIAPRGTARLVHGRFERSGVGRPLLPGLLSQRALWLLLLPRGALQSGQLCGDLFPLLLLSVPMGFHRSTCLRGGLRQAYNYRGLFCSQGNQLNSWLLCTNNSDFLC